MYGLIELRLRQYVRLFVASKRYLPAQCRATACVAFVCVRGYTGAYIALLLYLPTWFQSSGGADGRHPCNMRVPVLLHRSAPRDVCLYVCLSVYVCMYVCMYLWSSWAEFVWKGKHRGRKGSVYKTYLMQCPTRVHMFRHCYGPGGEGDGCHDHSMFWCSVCVTVALPNMYDTIVKGRSREDCVCMTPRTLLVVVCL